MSSPHAGGPAPAASHVASLTRSFALVPPAAVPAIVDCVLASAALPPSELFFSLLDFFAELTEGLRKNCSKLDPAKSSFLVSYTAALFHLVKNPGISHDAFRLFIWRGFVPLLRATSPDDWELLNQFEDFLCDAVTVTRSWELMDSTVLPLCLSSVGLSLGISQHREFAVYSWGSIQSRELGSLPLAVACRLLSSLLDTVLRVGGPLGQTPVKEITSAVRIGCLEAFARNLTWDLSHTALDMLLQSVEHRSSALRLVFPTIFRALVVLPSFEVLVNEAVHSFSRACFFKNVWEKCITLFSLGHSERIDACNLLSLYLSILNLEGDVNIVDEVFDIRAENKFWEEIRRGLVDKDASVRKHSLYILKKLSHDSFQMVSDDSPLLSLNSEASINGVATVTCHESILSRSRVTRREKWAAKEAKSMRVGEIYRLSVNNFDRWKAFFLLYDMLEEYGTHLVEAAWNHQISLFFECGSCDNVKNKVTGGLYPDHMETLDGVFSWLAILWERGLFHENPQVRCLIMQSFLGMDWDTRVQYAKHVPKSFILGPFILGLSDVVHHKDFGFGGVYTSKTMQGAAKFFHHYSGELSRSERLAFICSLASHAWEESFGRPGLMAFALCLSSAACQTKSHHDSEVQNYEDRSPEMECVELDQAGNAQSRCSELLNALGVIVERSRQHFNPNYRLQVCEKVLDAASFVICPCCMPLETMLHFLSALPREFTDSGGTLRRKVQQWLHNGCNGCLHSSDSGIAILRNLLGFPTSFLKLQVSTDAFISFDDEDLDAWGFEVQRWVRVLFLVMSDEQPLESIYQVVRDIASSISRHESSLDWSPPKFLILIICLLEELQILWGKYKCYSGSSPGFEVGINNIIGQLSLSAAIAVFKNFKDTFLFILDNLMSFASSVCSIFWSAFVEDTNLPSSVKGKLGGRSQRRLPLLTTTTLLQAILSMKTVASISSWAMQFEKDLWHDSSFAFLWNFSWKVILLPSNASEAEAEIHLAAYEALVNVLKSLSAAFCPLAIEFVIAFNMSTFPNGQEEPLLDSFLLNFLKNINILLAEGILTQSRRSILMNWKWLCLDSLLSIPYNVIESGAQASTACSLFSDSTLRITFSDIVESLGNAGETSVLPLLRSVRSIIGLLCPGRLSSMISFCNGMDAKMMVQLVQSSWILHLSCNKRRIAPIASLLSSVLHPSVFSDLSMHETTYGDQGPLKWFIEKILDEGTKSPRTIRLAALHLTGLWLSYPKTVKYYIKELMLLSLYGSVAFDEDFESELSENQEAASEVSMLSKCPDAELTEVFINTEMYARVSVAVLFDKLGNFANTVGDQKDSEDAQSALLAGKMFLLQLLDSAFTDKDLAKELYKKYSAIHRRKVRAWQMICILSRFVDREILNQVSSMLHVCLYRNNLPAVRQYLEIFAIQIYLKFPSLVEEQLLPIFHDYNVRPQALSSYVFIAANVIIHADGASLQLKHLNSLLPPIIPLLTSHHHSLRGFTQLLVYHVLCKLQHVLEPCEIEVLPLEKKCFKELQSYLSGNVDCVRLRASMEGFLSSFDPSSAAHPAGVFNARNDGSDFECVPITLMEQVITFLNDVREDLRYSMAKNAMSITNESLAVESGYRNMKISLDFDGYNLGMPTDSMLDFQKKFTLNELQNQPSVTDATGFLSEEFFQTFLSETEKEDQLFNLALQSRNVAIAKLRGGRQQFILVASLLDRIPNLAGLARTCEVFKAAGLAISDTNIVHDKQFQLISVTADKWVPIIEVPVCSIKTFLEKKKSEGFSILGLEQTANSTPLDQFPFLEKTVLVLGREKEGIPVDIIHCLDACLEIPQLGVIRSLNVHVSGAIALWEYTRQQRLKCP